LRADWPPTQGGQQDQREKAQNPPLRWLHAASVVVGMASPEADPLRAAVGLPLPHAVCASARALATASVSVGALCIARPPVGRAPPLPGAVLAPVGFDCQGATQTFRTVFALR